MAILLEAIAGHSEKVVEIEMMGRIERNDTIEGLLAKFEGFDRRLSRLEAIDPIVGQRLRGFSKHCRIVVDAGQMQPGQRMKQ